jgi:hypothetical protein
MIAHRKGNDARVFNLLRIRKRKRHPKPGAVREQRASGEEAVEAAERTAAEATATGMTRVKTDHL